MCPIFLCNWHHEWSWVNGNQRMPLPLTKKDWLLCGLLTTCSSSIRLLQLPGKICYKKLPFIYTPWCSMPIYRLLYFYQYYPEQNHYSRRDTHVSTKTLMDRPETTLSSLLCFLWCALFHSYTIKSNIHQFFHCLCLLVGASVCENNFVMHFLKFSDITCTHLHYVLTLSVCLSVCSDVPSPRLQF